MVCSDLHLRLKQARERRGLTLTAIARAKGVREQNLELIERNAFEDLPTGLYGRAAVRAYASAVGFEPDAAVADVVDRLRVPEDPIDGLARVRGIDRPRPPRRVEVAASVARPVRLPVSWRTPAAAIIDSSLLLAIDAILLTLTALVAGVRVIEILHVALPSMVVVFALIAGLYFVLLGGVRRATIGARLVQAEPTAVFDGPGVHAAMQRGWRYALDEGASLFGRLGRSVVR
jgi:transcriptional regulator with XRE-family HTH domain